MTKPALFFPCPDNAHAQRYKCTDGSMALCTLGRMYRCTNGRMYKCTSAQMAVCAFIRLYIRTDGVTAKRQNGTISVRTFVQTALRLNVHTHKGTQVHTAYCLFIRMDITPNGDTAEQPFGFSAVLPFGLMDTDIKRRTRKKNGKMCFCTYKLPFARTKTTCHLGPVAAKTIAPKSQSDGIKHGKTPLKRHKNDSEQR